MKELGIPQERGSGRETKPRRVELRGAVESNLKGAGSIVGWEQYAFRRLAWVAVVVGLAAAGCEDTTETEGWDVDGGPGTDTAAPSDTTEGPVDAEDAIHRESDPLRFRQIHAVGGRTCGVTTSAELRCWGDVDSSDLPSGSFKFASAGVECAIRMDGSVECWGDVPNPEGQFRKLSDSRGCGITEAGNLSCWTEKSRRFRDATIRRPDGGSGADAGAPGGSSHWVEGPFRDVSDVGPGMCAVRTSGELECWSFDKFDGPVTSAVEVTLGGLEPGLVCVRKSDGSLQCAGYEQFGGAPSGSFQSVSVGSSYNGALCAVRTNGELVCRPGTTGYGGLGDVDAPKGDFQSVTVGNRHACALRADDTIVCWGQNKSGESRPPQN